MTLEMPDAAAAAVEAGERHLRAGRLDAADRLFRHALAFDPAHLRARTRLAECAYCRGDFDGAERLFRDLAAEGSVEAVANLGATLLERGRPAEAAEHLRLALAVQPEDPVTLTNLGNACRALGMAEEAVRHYRQALALAPGLAAAAANLGDVLHGQGLWREADEAYARALAAEPGMAAAAWKRCFAPLATLYRDEDELASCRREYAARLAAFAAAPPEGFDLGVAGLAQPFLLAYQGADDRELQTLWGATMAEAARRSLPDRCRPPPHRRRRPGEPLRVGFVSGFFFSHSVWKIPLGGWLETLDRRRFRLFGYHTRGTRDSVTDQAAAACHRFVQGPLPVSEWARLIAEDGLDVLIFPEIGMDASTMQIAALRLAPVQCVSQGHPTTTGLPTIDYWLSSAAMEPEGGERHYTETLVHLPGLGFSYTPRPPSATRMDRADIGVPDDAVMIWCCQYISKYLPRHDDIFPRIARRVPNARFVFLGGVRGRTAGDILQERLDRAFARHGLRAADHVVMLDRMPAERFDAVTRLADLALDTPGWSGNNSTLECLALGLPVLTRPGPLMRSRHAAGILRVAGLDGLVCDDSDALVDRAVALCGEPPTRLALRREIAERLPRCHGDRTPMEAAMDFLEAAVKRAA